MNKPDPLLFSLQQLSIDISLINRNHYLAGTPDRRENDMEHSATVVLLCWFIYSHYNIPLDLGRILKYALAHDFVERYAGDTNTYASTKDRVEKVKREQAALLKFKSEFKDFPDLITVMQNYEDKADEEALFVWTVDKMQALILGDMDNWRPYEELHISYEQFTQKCKEHLAAASPYSKEIFNALIEYSKGTYYDQPR